MINLSELLDRAKKKALEKPDNKDGYAPKSTDELRFKRKHVSVTTPDANKNGDDVFKGTNVKAVDRQPHYGYNPGQDEEVYEEVKKKKVCKKCGKKYTGKQCSCCMNEAKNRRQPEGEEIYEEQYKRMAMAHKNRAAKALKVKDYVSLHHHLANYHESMAKWHESKDRDDAADHEYHKSFLNAELSALYANPIEYRKNFNNIEEAEKPDHLAAIAAAAKKKNAQIGKTVVTGSKGGVGGAETRRYPAGTLKNSHEPEGEELNELSKETLKSYTRKAVFSAKPSRVKGLIKATNKLYLKQYEEVEPEGEELEEAKRKKSPTEKLFNRLKNYGVKDPSAKPLVGNQHKIDANKNGKIDAEDFKMLRKEDVQVDEVLKPSMGAGAYVSDFVHSKNPKFAGKSKKDRMKQALAAYYSAKRGD